MYDGNWRMEDHGREKEYRRKDTYEISQQTKDLFRTSTLHNAPWRHRLSNPLMRDLLFRSIDRKNPLDQFVA